MLVAVTPGTLELLLEPHPTTAAASAHTTPTTKTLWPFRLILYLLMVDCW
jgi:hypothetical protein